MEQKLNIAEILKDKPQGTKLYSSTFGYIKFNGVYKDKIYFFSEDTNAHSVKQNGKMYDGGECIIFPSKEMRDWGKFSWKKGDILRHNTYEIVVMFDSFINNDYTKFKFNYKLGPEQYDMSSDSTERFTKVSEQETKSYITQIETEYDVKFNNEISEFEKTPAEFKDGDVEKKQIVDLEPKIRFKPFDKVVVFDELAKKWECGIFSHYSKNYEGKEVITCIGGCTYFKVLPFNEETAKLIGTTKDMEI